MKTYIYTIEDEYLGIPLTVEGELVAYERGSTTEDHETPFIVIQDISYCEKPLEMWCLSESFIKHCQNRIFQEWCSEINRRM
jgi:hypothetical protein